MDRTTAVVLVRVLAIFGYLGAAATLMLGLMLLFFGTVFNDILTTLIALGHFPIFMGWFVPFGGIVLVLFSVLEYFVARGLWEFKNWARVLTIFFQIFQVLSYPWGTLVAAVIIYFLGFNKEVLSLFLPGQFANATAEVINPQPGQPDALVQPPSQVAQPITPQTPPLAQETLTLGAPAPAAITPAIYVKAKGKKKSKPKARAKPAGKSKNAKKSKKGKR